MSLSSKKNGNKGGVNWPVIVAVVLVFLAMAAVIWLLLRGETTIANMDPDLESMNSLSCRVDDVEYPFASYDGAVSKTITVNALFDDDTIESISLIYSMEYEDSSMPKRSESVNHAKMNFAFRDSGLGADALGANYSYSDKHFRISLYANKKDYDSNTAKFFMLDEAPRSMSRTRTEYEKQGFDCTVKK